MQKRRTTTSLIVDLLAARGPLSVEGIEFWTGEPRNRITAALFVLEAYGAVRRLRDGRFRSTPGRDLRTRAIEFIVDPIFRNRTTGTARQRGPVPVSVSPRR